MLSRYGNKLMIKYDIIRNLISMRSRRFLNVSVTNALFTVEPLYNDHPRVMIAGPLNNTVRYWVVKKVEYFRMERLNMSVIKRYLDLRVVR